ncbi:hypothetical protein ORI20_32765 [Mycobacterium sp. CVI_P3]|uniref:Uncharacterized protein n=1 Tax=Mycobacterium pinniadriaticum TaxID=2994102 RepID=A0ABT3SQI3_9MYCO|nr:hypothetical protein [Mycobacterium pinniadriaticum]MCX2935030.1 hypothetical protein [Mycobacterium pinniadriaticum]MCX2941454.1 hypothetical protein [Mycobacterium pinniadriaticum]
MLEIEALETEVWKAFDGWLLIFNDTLELAAAVPHAFRYVVDSVDEADWTHINGVLGIIAGKTYDACKNVIVQEHRTLYVLSLLASWGAFESFIEEVTKAALRAEPALVAKPEFAKTTRKVAERNLSPADSQKEIIDKMVNGQRGRLTEDGDGKYGPCPRVLDTLNPARLAGEAR